MITSINFDPTTFVAATLSGVGTIISIIISSMRASRDAAKISNNQVKAAEKIVETQNKVVTLTETTDKIHTLANGNITELNNKLARANDKIAELSCQLIPNSEILKGIAAKIDNITNEMAAIRERQHDLTNFIHAQGLAFKLKPIPEFLEEKQEENR